MPTNRDSLIADRVMHSTFPSANLPDDLCAALLTEMSDAVSVHSTSGEIVWANKRLCDLYRKPLSELKGSSCQQVFHVEDLSCPHEQVVETGSGLRLERQIRKSGQVLSARIQPVFDESGVVSGFLRVLHDVTDVQRIQNQLLKAERFAGLGQILSGIAHDAGTPLNVISGYCEFLLMRTQAGSPGHKELSTILHQTRRIATMFGEALDLARAPRGRTDAIEIKPLVVSALDLVGYYLREASVKADVTCRMSPPLVYGEASQLRQAFFNLLLNTSQQVGPGGKLEVVIDEAPDGLGFLAVSFWGTEHSGAGHDFSRSLGDFFAEPTHAGPVGVGLYLSREILNDAGAKVSFKPTGDQGVPLIVYVPVNSGSRLCEAR